MHAQPLQEEAEQNGGASTSAGAGGFEGFGADDSPVTTLTGRRTRLPPGPEQ